MHILLKKTTTMSTKVSKLCFKTIPASLQEPKRQPAKTPPAQALQEYSSSLSSVFSPTAPWGCSLYCIKHTSLPLSTHIDTHKLGPSHKTTVTMEGVGLTKQSHLTQKSQVISEYGPIQHKVQHLKTPGELICIFILKNNRKTPDSLHQIFYTRR